MAIMKALEGFQQFTDWPGNLTSNYSEKQDNFFPRFMLQGQLGKSFTSYPEPSKSTAAQLLPPPWMPWTD